MELFHASRNKSNIGDIIFGGKMSHYYPAATNAIDAGKPNGVPARQTALYCADSAEFAVFFLKKEKVPENLINLYKVETDLFHKAPFAITHVVEQNLSRSKNVDALVKEYWNPTKNWNYYEYLVFKFEVIEQISIPTLQEIVLSHRSGQDHELATTIS